MLAQKRTKSGRGVVSARRARANFDKLLQRVQDQRDSLVIRKRASPRAILLSIQGCVRLASPEPGILRIIGEGSIRNGTKSLTSREIDEQIAASRRMRMI